MKTLFSLQVNESVESEKLKSNNIYKRIQKKNDNGQSIPEALEIFLEFLPRADEPIRINVKQHQKNTALAIFYIGLNDRSRRKEQIWQKWSALRHSQKK